MVFKVLGLVQQLFRDQRGLGGLVGVGLKLSALYVANYRLNISQGRAFFHRQLGVEIIYSVLFGRIQALSLLPAQFFAENVLLEGVSWLTARASTRVGGLGSVGGNLVLRGRVEAKEIINISRFVDVDDDVVVEHRRAGGASNV